MNHKKYKLEKEFVLYKIADTKMMEREIFSDPVSIVGLVRIKAFDTEEEAQKYIIDSSCSYVSYVLLPTYTKAVDYD